VDIDGAVQIDATFTSGVDGQGYDTKFFGDTSGAYILWDTSADKLLTAGGAVVDIVQDKLLIGGTAVTTTAAELNILDGVTSTAAELNILDGVTSTAAELNILDGVTSTAAELNIVDGVTSTAAELNLVDGSSANSVVNSKAAIYGSSGELAGTLSTVAQGNITSLGTLSTLAVTTDISLASQVLNCFGVQINNNSGTLRHRMGFGQVAGTTASNFIDRISNASTTYADTPTGTDADTAFASGLKVSTTSAYAVVFDVAAQTTANGLATAVIQDNSTGTALNVAVDYESFDVNGTTRNRMSFYYTNASSGAAFNINTTNIPSGKNLITRFYGHLA
jgi:hypothetical protein